MRFTDARRFGLQIVGFRQVVVCALLVVLVCSSCVSDEQGTAAAGPDDGAGAAEPVDDLEARAVLIADCVRQRGFPAEAAGGEVVFGEIPSEQGEGQVAAFEECGARYPLPEAALEPLNESQMRLVYDYKVNELAPCLEGLGYDIPEAPPVDVWMEQPDPPTFWDPWIISHERHFGELTVEDMRAVRAQCPTDPPLSEILEAR